MHRPCAGLVVLCCSTRARVPLPLAIHLSFLRTLVFFLCATRQMRTTRSRWFTYVVLFSFRLCLCCHWRCIRVFSSLPCLSFSSDPNLQRLGPGTRLHRPSYHDCDGGSGARPEQEGVLARGVHGSLARCVLVTSLPLPNTLVFPFVSLYCPYVSLTLPKPLVPSVPRPPSSVLSLIFPTPFVVPPHLLPAV